MCSKKSQLNKLCLTKTDCTYFHLCIFKQSFAKVLVNYQNNLLHYSFYTRKLCTFTSVIEVIIAINFWRMNVLVSCHFYTKRQISIIPKFIFGTSLRIYFLYCDAPKSILIRPTPRYMKNIKIQITQ